MALAPLPVDAVLPQLLAALEASGAAVLRAPTGTGKTTRVPPALLDAGIAGQVIVLEPRRVAARAAARRMASEHGTRLGEAVGYHVRFDRKASRRTRLLVATEGVLLRRLQDDPLLEGVGAVVFDEFHERSLTADLALALTERVRRDVRPDLKILVMSATLDPAPVAAFLGDAPIVESEGRAFPVGIEHRPMSAEDRIERAVRSAVLDVLPRSEGDVLVFLPGVGEIRRCADALAKDATVHAVDLLPLHGELAHAQQDAALAEGSRRKVILATNVAETSLTIPGVRVVIDSGLERLPRLDPAVGLERLETVRVARESADQRAGRAGRTAPGVCLRLYSASEDARLATRRPPEVQRADLAAAALGLYAWGESDLATFPWFEAPPRHALDGAERLLGRLGAVRDGRITAEGRWMSTLPTHPRIARMLVEARTCGYGRRIALAAAILGERSPFVPLARDHALDHQSDSDVLDLVEALEAFERSGRLGGGVRPLRRGPARQVLQARDQLARGLGELGGASLDQGRDADEAVLRAVLAGYPDRIARRRAPDSERAVLSEGQGVRLSRECAVREPELFVCTDVDAGRRGERAEGWVRRASAIERAWLPAERIEAEELVTFDAASDSVRGLRRVRLGALTLEEVAIQVPRGPAVEAALAAAAAANPERALALEDPAVTALRARVACLRAWHPALDLPSLDDEAVLAMLPDLCRGRRSFAELRKAPLLELLQGRFTWDLQQALAREAPEHIEVPSGNRIRLRYEEGRPPVLAARIQELFGLLETPTVAGGRVKVLMHLLAPNRRPQQITDDMPSFWANTYGGIRSELRRRYPKHAWPEDPYTAKAERRPKRRR